jgi:hypothetical protein
MKDLRKHIATRLLFGLLALHILNISIDPPDFYSEEIPEDLSYNEMESIIELVLEKGLNIENAIPETDDNDNNFHFKFDKKIDFFIDNLIVTTKPAAFNHRNKLTINKLNNFLSSDFIRSIAQPPEV